MVTRIVSRGMCLDAAARRTRSRLVARGEAATVPTSPEVGAGVAPGRTSGPDVGASGPAVRSVLLGRRSWDAPFGSPAG